MTSEPQGSREERWKKTSDFWIAFRWESEMGRSKVGSSLFIWAHLSLPFISHYHISFVFILFRAPPRLFFQSQKSNKSKLSYLLKKKMVWNFITRHVYWIYSKCFNLLLSLFRNVQNMEKNNFRTLVFFLTAWWISEFRAFATIAIKNDKTSSFCYQYMYNSK